MFLLRSGLLSLPIVEDDGHLSKQRSIYRRFWTQPVISSYLGETAANLRKVFDYASRGNWVIFFDEFDAIGKSRDDSSEHGELKRVINSFLQLIDGFRSDSIVIAATNHEDLLDFALWRRFDEVVLFGPPTREQIFPLLELKLASMRHINVNLTKFIPKLIGMTYADIERICYDAMKICILANEQELSTIALKEAIDRHQRRLEIITGSQRPLLSNRISEAL